MNRLRLNISVAALLLAGCTPLQQAPLVYTSTSTFGVGAALNTTEGPGFDFTLGYKAVDSAYVPVAISKDGEYQLQLVTATKKEVEETNEKNDTSIESQNRNNAKTNLTAKENQLKQDRQSKKTSEESKRNEETNHSNLNIELTRLKNELQSIDSNDPTSFSPITNLESLISIQKDKIADSTKKIDGFTKDIKDYEERIKIAEQERDQALKAYETASEEYSKINPNGTKSGDGSKSDAYSVYGSFDSKNDVEVDGSTPNLNNNLGKVFSTGVAAQTLAEAEKYSSINSCLSTLHLLFEKNPSLASTGNWSAVCLQEPHR